MNKANFSRPGAIDLSALRKPPSAPAGSPTETTAGGGTAPYVVDVTEQTFQQVVIDRSLQHLVVVEFWSPRSQASAQLGEVLTALSTEYDGKFLLARIDVDANPGLAQAVGVQAIPLVIGVLRGQVVPLFQGAVSDAQARQYLEQLVNLAVANGVTGKAQPVAAPAAEVEEPVVDERILKAEDAVGAGDLDGAIAAYQEILDAEPNNAVAKSGLLRVELVRRVQDAPADLTQRAADPTDVEAQKLASDLDLLEGRVTDAFDRLIRTVQATSGDERDKARLHLLELFDVVGADDERVTQARRKLMMALF